MSAQGPATHSALPDRPFSASRGVCGRIQIPGSTRLIVATDGSWKANHGGCGYVTRNGYWAISARRMKGRLNPIADHGTGALVLELRAVGLAVATFPGRAQRLLIDSHTAISYLQSWQAGDVERMPPGYSLRPRLQGGAKPALVRIAESIAGRENLRFVHVHAHQGHAMNEVADSLAKLARRSLEEKASELEVAERASRMVERFLAQGREAS